MMKAGVRDIHESGDPHVKRLYTDEPSKVCTISSLTRILRHRKTISQIVRYFHAASLKGEESRAGSLLDGARWVLESSLVENSTGA